MGAPTVWYFAYGSNLSTAQMKSRAGDVPEGQVATLANYELVFNRKVRGGAAAANIRPAPGKRVLGVLYRVSDAALRNLDRYEGVPEHYRRIEVKVSGPHGQPVNAQVYIATKVEKGLRPAAHYLQSILAGAAEHSLPADYVEEIKAAAGVS
jgi:cation transport regulator ChaC